jgi:hypothetical protein
MLQLSYYFLFIQAEELVVFKIQVIILYCIILILIMAISNYSISTVFRVTTFSLYDQKPVAMFTAELALR